MKFITPYNRKVETIRDCSVVKFTSPSKVKESLGYATDINEIWRNYCRGAQLPLNGQQPLYDENFVKYDSLIEAQKLVNDASMYFQGLPAYIKNQYGNSLEKFVKALNVKDDFLVKEGVLNLPQPEVKPVSPVDDIIKDAVNAANPVNSNVNTATTD